MSSHLFYLGKFEAERAVAEGLRGSGPEPAAPEPACGPGARAVLAARARAALGAAVIRAGEAIRGAEDVVQGRQPSIEPGCSGRA